MGIEPTFEAWEAPVLPLNYTRDRVLVWQFTTDNGQESPSEGEEMLHRDDDSEQILLQSGTFRNQARDIPAKTEIQ